MGGTIKQFALFLAAIAVSAAAVTGQDLSPRSENAALYYYQAMLCEGAMNAAFPDSETRLMAERNLVEGVFDEDAERYLGVMDRYITRFNRGATMTECRWNVELPGSFFPRILSKMKYLARTALGRYEYVLVEKRDEKEAVDQFIAVWNSSGNFEEHRVFIGMLVRNAIRAMSAARLERTLPALGPEALNDLRNYFERQYENRQWDLGDRLRQEIELLTQIVDSRPDSSASEESLTKWKHTVADSLPTGRKGIGFDELGEALRKERACMDAAVAAADIADTIRFKAAIDAYESEWKTSERFVPEWIGAEELRGFHEKATLDRVRLAQIACALRIATAGPDALDSLPDPATGAPFEMTGTESGFTLRSGFMGPDREPVSFTFSRPVK